MMCRSGEWMRRGSATAVLLLMGSAAVAQSARVQHTYDVRFLVTADRDHPLGFHGTPNADNGGFNTPPLGGESDEAVPTLALADLLAMLKDSVGASIVDGGSPTFDGGDNGFLAVDALPEEHQRIAACLAQLADYFADNVVVEVHELAGTVLSGGRAVLDAEAADRLLEQQAPHSVYRGVVGFDRSLRLQDHSSVTYLRDLDVEVAQSATIPDPKIDVLHLGGGWRVALLRTTDGRCYVQVLGDRAEPLGDCDEVDVRTTDSRGNPETDRIQLPHLRHRRLQAQALLTGGQAMLLGASTEDGGAFCIRVRRPSAKPTPSGPDWSCVPAAFLTRPHQRSPVFGIPRLRAPDDDSPAIPAELDDDTNPRVMGLDALVQSLLPCVAEGDGSLVSRGDLLWVRSTPQQLAAVTARLTELAAPALRQVSVEVRIGALESSEVARALDGSADPAELAGRFAATAFLAPAPLGDWFQLRLGKETSYVKDYEVEIAQDAVNSNPVIGVVFEGTSLRGRVLPVGEGRHRLELDFGEGHLDGDIHAFDSKNPRLGAVQQPRFQSADFHVTPVVDNGAWVLVNVVPQRGTSRHLCAVARVRE